ncbi:LAME_0D03400g1_1 [Lachancea meyersii CBS 8951]|uniref:Large ribosomal subunit protein uL23m n=1 Tax=Lachancea meyersii CBS 8951 TaxID=1266667 RepID=A0A1G4J7J6_9SACH|nr:LAME_0D03400g1_1 [Lachancea meyersii CBS 8951]
MPQVPRLLNRAIGETTKFLRNKLPIRTLATAAAELPKVDDQSSSSVRVSDKILNWSKEAIEQGKPHFRVGEKQLFFPKARVILLRPGAKHTPYQAKFIVPKSFNKLDLRDYLYNLYGLRALNITTQLLHGKYTRVNQVMPRYRTAQIKKMTIDMAEPFIWPDEPENKDPWGASLVEDLNKYREEQTRIGSDKLKPGTAFDGALGPYQPGAQPFVPKFLKRRLINQSAKAKLKTTRLEKISKVDSLVHKMGQ